MPGELQTAKFVNAKQKSYFFRKVSKNWSNQVTNMKQHTL